MVKVSGTSTDENGEGVPGATVKVKGDAKGVMTDVDGVERSMDLVDPEDIQSFSILKDATATALYGVRGANGIVLITTKRGSESKPRVSAKVEYGFTGPLQLPELAITTANPEQFRQVLTARPGQRLPIGNGEPHIAFFLVNLRFSPRRLATSA